MATKQFLSYEWAQIYFFGILIFSFIFAAVPLLVSKSILQAEKASPYECGVEPFGHFFQYVNIQFFMVAVLFLIFDLEIVFLLPWVVNASKMQAVYGTLYFVPFYFFMIFLFIGYVYEWWLGVLDWSFGDLKN